MAAPIPIYATPTLAARRAFLQAVYAKGFNWCGSHAVINEVTDDDDFTHVYLRVPNPYRTKGPSVYFVETPTQLEDVMARGTLVNSPRQFISYVRRHEWTGDPST